MIERRIVIALITSTDFIQRIYDKWNIHFIASSSARYLSTWCIEFYNQYKVAPGKAIEDIYYQKLRKGLPKDLAEDIKEILQGLSEEYENTNLNVDYLVTETLNYIEEQYLSKHNKEVQGLLENGQRKDAEKLIRDFKPFGVINVKLNEHIQTVNQILRKGIIRPTLFMRPWLRAGQTTIIYGGYGTGKSLLTLLIAYVLGLDNYEDSNCEIAEWRVIEPTGCLYIDGELGEIDVAERIKQFEWIGKQPPKYRFKVFSIPEYQLETEDSFYLSLRENQQKIIKWLQDNPTYRLIVLDSITTLFGLVDENNNAEWNNKIHPFLRDLRALGVANILLHHAGKDNKKGLRGASAMGAMAHNIFRLTDHEKKNIDKGEAWFVIKKDKQRASGFSFKTFALKFTQNHDQTETYWDETDICEF